jgi:hypothetical protein
MKEEKMTLVTAIHNYFGKKEGQSLLDFSKEIKALTQQDKLELVEMLSKALGIVVTLE